MRSRTGAGPQWSVEELRLLVGNAHISRNPLRDVRLVLGCGDRQARDYIRRMLKQLAEGDFYERFLFRNAQGRMEQLDVYCLRDTSDGDTLVWYVKLCVRNGVLVVNSFHEPEQPMT